MNELKFKSYIKSLHIIAEVKRINFDCRTVEVDLSDGEADLVEYNFDEVEIMQYTGLRDKNNDDIYTNQMVMYCGEKFKVEWDEGELKLTNKFISTSNIPMVKCVNVALLNRDEDDEDDGCSKLIDVEIEEE